MCLVGTVALFSLWTKSFRGDQNLDPSWQFFGFIRTCQNPIGRASTKNWKLWLFHIKWKVGKKVTNYVFHLIRTCHHPIREGIDQKLKYKQKTNEMKGWKKNLSRFFTFSKYSFITLTFYNQNWIKKNHSVLTLRDLSF